MERPAAVRASERALLSFAPPLTHFGAPVIPSRSSASLSLPPLTSNRQTTLYTICLEEIDGGFFEP